MIRKYSFYVIIAGVLFFLVYASLHYKGGGDAMVAIVESQNRTISYRKPVLIKEIYVSPGQIVDSGDLLIEVERPDLSLDLDKLVKDKQRLNERIAEAISTKAGQLQILQADFDRRINELNADKEKITYNQNLAASRKKKIEGLSSLPFEANDTLLVNRLLLIDKQLQNYTEKYQLEKDQIISKCRYDTAQYNAELNIINKEIEELYAERKKLVQHATKPSTIGNLFVDRNELVPSFKKILSVYDLNPNTIKAFIHERRVKDLRIGSKVRVESVHKNYSIEGEIVEIGSRITSYPDKINPLTSQKSYGQEIFINIPDKNDFLNGEKVYVYVVDEK
jgi:multidrug resistance efflux pump